MLVENFVCKGDVKPRMRRTSVELDLVFLFSKRQDLVNLLSEICFHMLLFAVYRQTSLGSGAGVLLDSLL